MLLHEVVKLHSSAQDGRNFKALIQHVNSVLGNTKQRPAPTIPVRICDEVKSDAV